MRRVVAMIFLAVAGLLPAAAQEASFEDFEKAFDEKERELDKFRAALHGEDPQRSRQAMEFMLRSGNQDLMRAARETGLFSPDRDLQNAALRAILDGGPRLRIVVKPDKKNSESVFYWARRQSGAHDETEGHVSLLVGPYKQEQRCWTNDEGRLCQWQLAGRNLNFNHSEIQGQFALEADGVLRGMVHVQIGSNVGYAPAQIDLTE